MTVRPAKASNNLLVKSDSELTHFPTFIAAVSQKLGLHNSCSGSKYAALFANLPETGEQEDGYNKSLDITRSALEVMTRSVPQHTQEQKVTPSNNPILALREKFSPQPSIKNNQTFDC